MMSQKEENILLQKTIDKIVFTELEKEIVDTS